MSELHGPLLDWLFKGLHKREIYTRFLLQQEHTGTLGEFQMAAWFLAAIVLLRLAFNYAFKARAQALLEQHATQEHHKDVWKLMEECWVLLGNAVMLCWSAWVMTTRNGGCSFFSTETCFFGWPLHPTPPAVRLYYSAELAWYCHLLLKPVLRYGLGDGRDMIVHHLCTLALVVGSYGLGLTRIGVLVLCCFNISNPFLHLAKVSNQLSLRVRVAAFALFAAVFFATRVVLVPKAILAATLLGVQQQVPYVVEDFWYLYLAFNALIAALYVLQLLWAWSIWRVLKQAITSGGDAASHLSAKVDPSKRYQVVKEAGVAAASSNKED